MQLVGESIGNKSTGQKYMYCWQIVLGKRHNFVEWSIIFQLFKFKHSSKVVLSKYRLYDSIWIFCYFIIWGLPMNRSTKRVLNFYNLYWIFLLKINSKVHFLEWRNMNFRSIKIRNLKFQIINIFLVCSDLFVVM